MRLVTRGNLDGLACAVELLDVEPVDEIALTHPQEITEKRFPVGPSDIVANLPFHPACGLWFDHHQITDVERPAEGFPGAWKLAPSSARVIYGHYGPERLSRHEELVRETDRFGSARLDTEDVLHPKGYILLGLTIDSRTSLAGPYQEYFRHLVRWLRTLPVDEVLRQPEVVDRVQKMRDDDARFKEALLAHSVVDQNIVVTDFRSLEQIPAGNRFLVYTLFPDCNVSVRLQWGPGRKTVMASVAHNIFDRSSWSNIGHTMALFHGGGHKGAGSCPLPAEGTEEALAALLEELKSQG